MQLDRATGIANTYQLSGMILYVYSGTAREAVHGVVQLHYSCNYHWWRAPKSCERCCSTTCRILCWGSISRLCAAWWADASRIRPWRQHLGLLGWKLNLRWTVGKFESDNRKASGCIHNLPDFNIQPLFSPVYSSYFTRIYGSICLNYTGI